MMKKIVKFSLAAFLLLTVVTACSKKEEASTNNTAKIEGLEKKITTLESALEKKEAEITELQGKTPEESPAYELDEALTRKIYDLYLGTPVDEAAAEKLQITYIGKNHSSVFTENPGVTEVYVAGQYAMVYHVNETTQLENFKVFDLATEKEVSFEETAN